MMVSITQLQYISLNKNTRLKVRIPFYFRSFFFTRVLWTCSHMTAICSPSSPKPEQVHNMSFLKHWKVPAEVPSTSDQVPGDSWSKPCLVEACTSISKTSHLLVFFSGGNLCVLHLSLNSHSLRSTKLCTYF